MAQNVVTFSGDPTGTQLLDTLLTGLQANSLTSNSGTARPSYAQSGTIWLDITTTPWLLKVFNGTSDIVLGAISTEFALNALAANSIVCNPTASVANSSTLALAANKFPARGSTGNIAAQSVSDAALTLIAQTTKALMRSAGLGLGTMAVQDANNVNITGGAISGIAGISGGWELLGVQTASSSSALDFTGLSAKYTNYAFLLAGLRTSAAGVNLLTRLSTSSGVFNSSGVYKYLNSAMTYLTSPIGPGGNGAAAQTAILFNTSIINRVSQINGMIMLSALAGEMPALTHNLNSVDAVTADMSHSTGSGIFGSTAQILGARFLPSSGNFVSGKIFCYGLKSS